VAATAVFVVVRERHPFIIHYYTSNNSSRSRSTTMNSSGRPRSGALPLDLTALLVIVVVVAVTVTVGAVQMPTPLESGQGIFEQGCHFAAFYHTKPN